MSKYRLIIFMFLLNIIITACAAEDVSNTKIVGGLEVKDVIFSKEFTDSGPANIGNTFYPTDIVYLTVDIKDRPASGIISAEAFWKEQFIDGVLLDLTEINSDTINSDGENTFATITLSPDTLWPISSNYSFTVYINEEKLGSYEFSVIPPEDAVLSKIETIDLAKGVDDYMYPFGVSNVFTTDDPVVLVGRGDFGVGTWFSVNWQISGEEEISCDTVIQSDQNYVDEGIFFACTPDNGWPPGEHSVSLIMNDEIIGTYSFTIE